MHLCQFAKPAYSYLRHFVAACALLYLGFTFQIASGRTPPFLDFDVPFTIGCRSLSIKEHARDGAFDLIEVVIPISARLRAGTERDLKQCVYTLIDPAVPETLVVTDWLPRTELKSDYAKPIQFSSERLGKIGISLAAHYVIGASGDASGQLKSGVVYEMLPPQETVLASGTVQYGHGVFFKLKPSTQTTLEGKKSFSAIFAVPRGWRGGCLKLDCEALGLDRGIVSNLDREVPGGVATFYLALYLVGDDQAETLAQRVGVREQELLDSLAQYRTMTATSHRPFSWSSWKWPKFSDKSAMAADAPTEEVLFNCVLDVPARPLRVIENLPVAIQSRFQALQQAAVALQALSVDTITPPASRFTGSRASFFAAPASQTSAENARPQSTPAVPMNATVSPRDLQGAQHLPAALSHAGSTEIKTDKVPCRPSAASRSTPAEHGKTYPAQSWPLRNGVTNGGELARSELREASKPSDPLSKEAWYLLVSMWGAVFTYIVAPIVVHFITNRKECARERSSAGARV
jgi:hypothetical protein